MEQKMTSQRTKEKELKDEIEKKWKKEIDSIINKEKENLSEEDYNFMKDISNSLKELVLKFIPEFEKSYEAGKQEGQKHQEDNLKQMKKQKDLWRKKYRQLKAEITSGKSSVKLVEQGKEVGIKQEREKCLKLVDEWWNDDLTCAGKPTCCIEDCDLCVDCFNRLKSKLEKK